MKDGQSTPEERARATMALVHTLTGDSWGLQESLVESESSGFVPGVAQLWPMLWVVGEVLRNHLSEADRVELVEKLRADVLRWRADGN